MSVAATHGRGVGRAVEMGCKKLGFRVFNKKNF